VRVTFCTLNVAVSTSLPPADRVTTWVTVCVPLATCVVFHGFPGEAESSRYL
jgi:hypothetical protein